MVLPAYPPKGHSAPLLFDSLEPRLLLNADVLAVDLVTANPAGESQHLLVRMIEESTRTATQAETVQRVQIVDRQAAGDTGVLAVRDLDKITGIAIFTGDGDDSLIIDHTSFDGADMPPVFFDGGAGNDRLDLVSPAPGVWDMNTPDSGTMTLAGSTITFAGVEEFMVVRRPFSPVPNSRSSASLR